MKFGAHSYIFTDRWSDSSLHFLEDAANLGLGCFEIGIGNDISFSHNTVRNEAERLGLELIVSPGGTWPIECDMSSENPSDRKTGLSWHKQQVDKANEIGAKAYCGSIYGHTGVVKKRKPLNDEYHWVAEGLNSLASYAEAKGVSIILEPMSHFRTHLINTPPQVMKLIEMSDHPNLWALLDTYHLITEVRDYGEGIKTVRKKLWGMHMCENDRGVPGGGLVPWASIFKAVGEIAFDGYLIMEAYNSSIGDFAYERGMFHNVCPDAETFVRDGLRFMKSSLAIPR